MCVCRRDVFRLWQFPGQFMGAVDQNRQMFCADLKITTLIAKIDQRDLAVVFSAVDACLGLVICHISSTIK
jgi:hypothetical protein